MAEPQDLIYYPDSEPGIRRLRCGRGFSYVAPDGTRIDRGAERARIQALAVPPAYERVWISPKPNGHLLATGYDARERKQYRYHPDWRMWRETRKYGDLADFGAALPRIRRRIRTDLVGEAGEKDFAIAAVLAMIDRLAMRVGSAEYAETNHSYGATTLTTRHLRLSGNRLSLSYTAKGGLKVKAAIHDAGLARVLGRLHDLPGRRLVSWVDEHGDPHGVTSSDVNHRLSEIVGRQGITAKTFRTWLGSEAAMSVAIAAPSLSIRAMAEAAAARLHNTPTIARNSYIHPEIIALAGQEAEERARLAADLPETAGLRIPERALLRLIG